MGGATNNVSLSFVLESTKNIIDHYQVIKTRNDSNIFNPCATDDAGGAFGEAALTLAQSGCNIMALFPSPSAFLKTVPTISITINCVLDYCVWFVLNSQIFLRAKVAERSVPV